VCSELFILYRYYPTKLRLNVNKINFIIVGAQKAGTTSLKNYQGEHPEISTHDQEEIADFVVDEEYHGAIEKAYEKYFHDYHKGTTLTAKNAILYRHSEGFERLAQYDPPYKIVILLRNPIDRMYSAFLMEQFYGSVKTDYTAIKEVIAGGGHDKNDWRYEIFVGTSLYFDHLKDICANFPTEQVKIFSFEDFKKDPLPYWKEVSGWMHVATDFQFATLIVHNETKKAQSLTYSRVTNRFFDNNNTIKKLIKKVIPASTNNKLGEAVRGLNKLEKRPNPVSIEMRLYLKSFFEPYYKELQQLTGFETELWNQ
jgi:Sulfotransferase domain